MVRTFRRALTELPALVAFTREFLRDTGRPEAPGDTIDLVLEELFTNLVRYGRGTRGPIEVELHDRDGGIGLVLRESDAERWDPTLAPEVDVTRPIAERRPGGLGIHFVRQLSHAFDYDY